MKLKVRFKKSWVKALRSGKYKQAHGKLYIRGTGYCCLGVARSISRGRLAGDQYNNYLSNASLAKIGLSEADQASLARMNDDPKSFEEIADYIEANL